MSSQHLQGLTDKPSLGGATVRFLAGWEQVQEGQIKRAGPLTIEYDPSRLEHCHTTWRGADIWNITAYVLFSPGGELFQGSVLDPWVEGGITVGHLPKPFQVTVPEDANQVQIWFRTFYELTSFCEAWDSRFGQNFVFDVK